MVNGKLVGRARLDMPAGFQQQQVQKVRQSSSLQLAISGASRSSSSSSTAACGLMRFDAAALKTLSLLQGGGRVPPPNVTGTALEKAVRRMVCRMTGRHS
jgi:hypothetical protein